MSEKSILSVCSICGGELIRVGDATTNTTWLKCPICRISSPAETFKFLCEKIKVAENALAVVPDGYQITKFEHQEMCDDTQREWSQIVAELEPIPLTIEETLDALDAMTQERDKLQIQLDNNFHNFHRAWTFCVGTEAYVKSVWMEAESQIIKAGGRPDCYSTPEAAKAARKDKTEAE